MLSYVDIAVMFAFLAVVVAFGLVVRRLQPSFSEYATAGKRVPATVLFASLSATVIGPGYSLGLAAKASQSGFLFLLVFACFSVQFVLVGWFVAPRLRRFQNAQTLGDVLEEHFNATAKKLIGLASVLLCIGLTAVIAKAGAVALSALLGWPAWLGIIAITVIGAYCALVGGLNAVVATEAFQFCIMAVVIALLVLLAVLHSPVDAVITAGLDNAVMAVDKMGNAGIIGLCTAFGLGELLIPPYANRALAARNEKVSAQVFIYSGLFSLLWFASICFIGVYAGFYLLAANEDMALINVGNKLLPNGGVGLLAAVIFAIVISSHASVINAGAASFVGDILPVSVRTTDKRAWSTAQMTGLAIAVLGAIFSIFSASIIDGLLLAYSVWVPVAVAPILCAAFAIRVPEWSGVVSMFAGFSGAIVARQFLSFEAAPILVGLLASVGVLLASWVLSGKQEHSHV